MSPTLTLNVYLFEDPIVVIRGRVDETISKVIIKHSARIVYCTE
jgi:hypothetical protein